ncbi:MAG: ABC transporter ATP-binding protein [Gemmatimonadaceae bacterium]
MTAAALALRGITRQFGRTIALDSAQFELRTGTLHALLGENGAGKTTLMRIAFGMLRPDAGTMELNGSVRHWRSSADAIAAGIGMVHQHFLLVPAMTVAENVSLGDRGPFRRFDARVAAERVRNIGAETGLVLDPASRVADLSVGAQQRLEIVKALARDVKILILDEPTAVLTPAESQELYAWLRSFVARGHTVVLITHKVREALALADDVTVLRRGRSVLSGRPEALGEPAVIDAMVGAIAASGVREPAASQIGMGAVVASLDGVSVTDERGVPRLRDVTMDVRAGEIVGVAGVEGSGPRELLRVLAGRIAARSGTTRIPVRIGFVPEDRLRDALIPVMTLVENFALKDASVSRGSMPWASYESRTRSLILAHDVRASGADSPAGALSGGNQQKFVLGRELEGSPELLVVENPTRGLDIRAAAHVLGELRAARASGVAVVAYSSDLDEVLSIADRMLVCFDGRITPTAADAATVARALVGIA